MLMSHTGTSPDYHIIIGLTISMKTLVFSAKEHSYGWDHRLGLNWNPKTCVYSITVQKHSPNRSCYLVSTGKKVYRLAQ